jgi:hypothetical protein
MKKIHLLCMGMCLVLSVNTGMAQTVNPNDSVTKVEKEYKGETYVINSSAQNTLRSSKNNQFIMSTTIANKNEGAFSGSGAGVCYNLKKTIPMEEVFKKAISKEKIKSLALGDKNGIIIGFYYDTNTGKVAYMRFILRGNITLSDDTDSETEITLKDINALESLFKEYYFDVSEATCEKFKFGHWYQPFWFHKLAEKEKE